MQADVTGDRRRPPLTLTLATATWLVLELTAAFTDLTTAAAHAETLVAIDHCYDHQYGYVGGLGWDLETRRRRRCYRHP